MTDLTGEILGDYRVEALIGRGPLGAVYRGTHVLLDHGVALKVIDAAHTGGERFKTRFVRHAESVIPLRHEHLAKVHHVGEQDAHAFVVSELMAGPHLQTVRPPETASEWMPSWWRSVELIRQATEALAAAHRLSISHGDLKLTDILLTTNDIQTATAKVTDLGLHRVFEDADAPPPDPADDVRAVGRLLYALTTGRDVPASTTATTLPSGVTVRPPRQLLAGYPDILETIVMRCLGSGIEPAVTMTEVVALLRGVAAMATASPFPAVKSVVALQGAAPSAIPGVARPARPPRPPDPRPGAPVTLVALDSNGMVLESRAMRTGMTIGSAPGNDVSVAMDGVDGHHLRLDFDGRRVTIVDLGSAAGTLLDDHRLLPQMGQEWGREQWLQAGSCWLWLQQSAAPTPPKVIEIILDAVGRRLSITPGVPQTCHVTLLNQTVQVDRLTLSVEGIPDAWVKGTNREILVQANGRKEATLTIEVPKTAAGKAGDYQVTLRVRSQANSDIEQGMAEAIWTVQPFDAMSVWVAPRKAAGWRSARYTLTLQNEGNHDARYTVSGSDEEKFLEFLFSGEDIGQVNSLPVRVAAGQKLPIKVTVASPWRWFGNPNAHACVVDGAPDDGSARLTTDVQFSHRPLLPVWALVLIPVLFVGGLMFGTRYMRPVVRPLAVAPRTPLPNERVEILWDAPAATSARLLVNELAVTPDPDVRSGKYVFPDGFEKDTRIRLIGYNLFGSASSDVTVTLRPQVKTVAKPANVLFTVDPPQVVVGQAVTLNWSTSDAARVELNLIGSVAAQGSYIDRPTSERTYTLTAYNDDSVATTKSMTVKVMKGRFVPTDMRLALSNPQPKGNGRRIEVGVDTSIVLDWQAKDATTVRIESIPAAKLEGGSGSRVATLTGEGRYTFTLVATDDLNQEYRTEPIEVWADCKMSRILKMKIPCSKTPQVEWK